VKVRGYEIKTANDAAKSLRGFGPAGLAAILIILAGIMGADGVILAAASAHQPDATRLASASFGGACPTRSAGRLSS